MRRGATLRREVISPKHTGANKENRVLVFLVMCFLRIFAAMLGLFYTTERTCDSVPSSARTPSTMQLEEIGKPL